MIKVDNLWKIYDKNTAQKIEALCDVSFNIGSGEVISIIGKSGSGKTTLLNILLGITKPTDGKILINDEIFINKKSKSKKLKKITEYILSSFQYPDHQLFCKTVKEELFFNVKDESYLNDLIKKFNFDVKLFDKSPFKLSSGQKRKLILLSILAQKPKIIIFDEPTSFLDPKSRREFIDLIKSVNQKLKTTIIFISHNIDDVISLSNRTILLDKGKLIKDDNTKIVVDLYQKGVY